MKIYSSICFNLLNYIDKSVVIRNKSRCKVISSLHAHKTKYLYLTQFQSIINQKKSLPNM